VTLRSQDKLKFPILGINEDCKVRMEIKNMNGYILNGTTD
jgi:hypothetical protein